MVLTERFVKCSHCICNDMGKAINYVNEHQSAVASDMNPPEHNRIELSIIASFVQPNKVCSVDLIHAMPATTHTEWLISIFKQKVSNFVFVFSLLFSANRATFSTLHLSYLFSFLCCIVHLQIWLVIFATMHKISISKLSTRFSSRCACVLFDFAFDRIQ